MKSDETALSESESEVFALLKTAEAQYARYLELSALSTPTAAVPEDDDYGYCNWDHPVSVCVDTPKHVILE